MATINKALTTYLPTDSVEWLEKYCLEFKHLVNKDGNPKLGTALADIVSRLADGGLTLPARTEQLSTVPDTLKYGTEINELKSEVEQLKKLVNKVLYDNVPSTVPGSIGLAEVKSEIDKALEPINEAIADLKSEMVRSIASRSTDTETVAVEIQAVESIEPQEHPTGDTKAESIEPQESKTKTEDRGESKAWVEFGKFVGLVIPPRNERNKANGDKLTEAAKEKGFSGWKYKSYNSTFVKVDEGVNS
jgi:hypothetical protein